MITPRDIHDYLDGSIDPATENRLFGSLATDATARQELTEQIRLHLAVKKDMAAIAVPPSVTAGIFTELGYAVPGAATVPAPVPTTNPWPRRAGLALLLLLFLGLGVGVTRQFWPRIVVGSSPTVAVSSSPASPSVAAPLPATTPVSAQGMIHSQRSPALLPHQSEVLVEEPTTMTTTADLQEAPSSHIAAPPTRPERSTVSALTEHSAITSIAEPSPWYAIARGVANVASDPFTAADLSGGSAFDQFLVGVSYDLSAQQRIALMGGRQTMPQEFTRTEGGRDVVYRQTPTLWWAGAMIEHSFTGLAVADVLEPFATATIGVMEIGPMARLGAGFHVFPQQRLSMDIGIETTAMLYPIQSVYYTSSTWSITYGIRYHF